MKMNVKNISFSIIGVIILGVLIGFASSENKSTVCNDVVVTIDNQLNNHYIDEVDVLNMVTDNGARTVIGETFARIDIREIEERVNLEPYIRDSEIFRDHKGNLVVNVDQRRPIARIIRGDGPDAYIADDGAILPVSDKFTSRVVLISGDGMKGLSESGQIAQGDYQPLFKLINYIKEDDFLRAQIAQIHFEEVDEIVMFPQVTKQLIEFGSYDNMEEKFLRLKVFYKQILPRKGWNDYTKVNLKYNDQIICE